MTFLLTLGLAVLGVGLAGAVLRAALSGPRPITWGRALAVGAVAVLVAAGLANAGDSFRGLDDKRKQWSSLSEAEAVEAGAGQAGVDPEFPEWAREHFRREHRVYLQGKMASETKSYLQYRFAPQVIEDTAYEADWLVYWDEPRGPAAFGLREDEIEHHAVFAPGVGMVKVRREG